MLSKLFKALAEQPYRYINVAGLVHDKPVHQRFYHLAEFKAAATAVSLAAANIAMIYKDPLGPVPFIIGAGMSYAIFRQLYGKENEKLLARCFGRMAVIDTQPKGHITTNPDDIDTAFAVSQSYDQNHSATLAKILILFPIAPLVLKGICNMTGPLFPPIEYLSTIMDPICGAAFVLGIGNITHDLSQKARMERVLNGEYVILPDPPKNQQSKDYEKIELRQPKPVGPASPINF